MKQTIKKILEKYKKMGLSEFCKKAIKKIIYYSFNKFLDVSGVGRVISILVKRPLREKIMQAKNIEDYLDIAFNFRFLGVKIRPMQSKKEIKELLEILKQLKPKNILEIGTAKGGTLFLFTMVAENGGKIISVDLPFGFWGGYPNWRSFLYKSFPKGDKKYI